MPDVDIYLTPEQQRKLESLRRALGYVSQQAVIDRLYELFTRSHQPAAVSWDDFLKHIGARRK